MKERITILMPVYNGEKYLRETIDSVLRQTYRDFIFLIINDGSTDITEEIILSYSDSRIRYVKNEQNLGLVKTLNKGIEMVKTEFLARMDADDLWDATKLEKQLQVFDARPEVGLCGTSIRKFGTLEKDFFFPVDNRGLKVGFLFYCCMSHPSVIFRMSFLNATGLRYREDYYPAEDYKMWVDCIRHTQIYNIPEKLTYYRQHENQITQESNSAQARMTNKVRIELLEELSEEFSETEMDFHLNSFLKSRIQSVADFKQHRDWANRLICLNLTQRAFDQPELKRILIKYIQAGYYTYLKKHYFSRMHVKGCLIYLLSFNWMHLSVKYNLKLMIKR